MIKPVIKWVGGKRKIMDKILEKIPTEFNNYYEPFIGGGSVFLNIPYKYKAFINDYNKDLTDIYMVIKNEPCKLVSILKTIENNYNDLKNIEEKKVFFIEQRKIFNTIKNNIIKKTALYIYINKCCFNGFMLKNKKDELVSSFGFHNKVNISDKDNILNFSKKLANVKITNTDYEDSLKNAKRGDFVYLDPPYVPDDLTKCNIHYNNNRGWNYDDFKRLFDMYDELNKRGVYVMMSNSYSKLIRKYFKNKKYNLKKIPIIRMVSRNKNTRGIKYEVIITNYEQKKINKTMKRKKKGYKKTKKNKWFIFK